MGLSNPIRLIGTMPAHPRRLPRQGLRGSKRFDFYVKWAYPGNSLSPVSSGFTTGVPAHELHEPLAGEECAGRMMRIQSINRRIK